MLEICKVICSGILGEQCMAKNQNLSYRLSLDLGTTSIGWAMVRLDQNQKPSAIIKAGVRIYSDGRNPKDKTSLAVNRREARSARRRRDRLVQRKAKMMRLLVELGFFPKEKEKRKVLEKLNPFEIRARGLDKQLQPEEFARALFHLNQRRGFKSNRKTDKTQDDTGALKGAISALRKTLEESKLRTVGELLFQRMRDGQTVRARYHERKKEVDGKKNKVEKFYDLYIDRQMVQEEFDALWEKQQSFDMNLYSEETKKLLKDTLLFQRPLKAVKPGRCTFYPEEYRAPKALPSFQYARILQEVNNLRIQTDRFEEEELSLDDRNLVLNALEKVKTKTFSSIQKLLKLEKRQRFNLEGEKRKALDGNKTTAILSKDDCFGDAWYEFSLEKKDEIVLRLLNEESEEVLLNWLKEHTKVSDAQADHLVNVSLVEGYGHLSQKALSTIIPYLEKEVITFDKAVEKIGIDHSDFGLKTDEKDVEYIDHIVKTTGEVQRLARYKQLPYYGIPLERHVAFGSGDSKDPVEKQFGKIANPTVHIGLNQIRLVVNEIIRTYGHPREVIVEVARDLKQSRDQRQQAETHQKENQKRNDRIREEVAGTLKVIQENVKRADIQKVILWEELNKKDPLQRRCPYSGELIGMQELLSAEVEIEHILPFSQTLDDSLNNKTVSLKKANRVKGNRIPWNARGDFEHEGWSYDDIFERAQGMPRAKRYRFAKDGYKNWLKKDKDFIARALNDTRYLSRIARLYLELVCPQKVRVIPGQMTALLRGHFGLNKILGLNGEKNRNNHRHHAIDACVIGVTDQGLLQQFSKASSRAEQLGLERLVEVVPYPWKTFRDHVLRAVSTLKVSHRPDHSHEGQMHDDTA